MRGILGGGIWGLVVGGAAVTSASLLSPPPVRDGDPGSGAAAAAQPEAPVVDQVAADQTADEQVTADQSAPTQIAIADAPDVTAPTVDEVAPVTPGSEAPVAAETAPAALSADAPGTAPAVDTADPVAADVAAAQAPNAAVAADDAPAAEDEAPAPGAEITSDVATITAPAAVDDAAGGVEIASVTAPTTGTQPEAVTAATPSGNVPATETTSGDQPSVGGTGLLASPGDAPETSGLDTNGDTPVAAIAAAPVTDLQDEADAPVSDNVAIQETAPTPDLTATAPQAVVPPVIADAEPEVAVTEDPVAIATDQATEAGTTAPEVVAVVDETPTVSVLPSGDTGVKVNRLGTDETPVAEADTAEAEAETQPDLPEDAPAIQRYAAAAANPGNLPALSVVLVDDGSIDNAVAAVAAITYPVTVMLDPSQAGVTDRMAAYRAKGIEVGVLASLPPSATPSDVAIFFEAALTTLPETVAVLDASGETQADTEVIRETIAALAADGRGLITVPRGLNSAQRLAGEAGVPAGTVFRDLDAEGQNARVIGRFMDQAAFRARQDGGVILLGRVRGETVEALKEWAFATRASQVSMQPVSAVLSAD